MSVVSYFKSHLGLHLWLFVPEFEGGPISGLWSTKKFILLGGIMLKIPFCSAIEGHGEFVPKKLTNLNEPNFSQLSLINGSLKWKLDLVRKLCKKASECNVFFRKTTILSGDFDLKFDLTLAPGSSLSNYLRTKLFLWSRNSTIVESMVRFIRQHNLPMEFYSTFEMPPRGLNCSALPLKLQNKQSERGAKVAFEISYHTYQTFVSAESVEHHVWPLEHFLRQGHLNLQW